MTDRAGEASNIAENAVKQALEGRKGNAPVQRTFTVHNQMESLLTGLRNAEELLEAIQQRIEAIKREIGE